MSFRLPRRLEAATGAAALILLCAACDSDAAAPAQATDAGDTASDAADTGAALDAGPDAAAAAYDPSEPGPYAVSVTTTSWRDEARKRTLKVDIWYPAVAPPGAEAAVYPVELVPGVELGRLPSPAGILRDADPDRSGGPYPVILFSHGNNGIRFQNFFQAEHLASRGYVFIAPDHTGNTAVDNDPNFGARLPILRPEDISFVLDEALRRRPEDGRDGEILDGLLDETMVGATGHSYGGYTVLMLGGAGLDLDPLRALCEPDPEAFGCDLVTSYPAEDRFVRLRDERVLAVAPLTPGFFELIGVDGVAELEVPVIVGGATEDRTTPYEVEHRPVYDAAPLARYLFEIEGAGHFGFSVMCDFIDALPGLESIFGYALEDGCGPDNLPDEDVKAITNRYVTAFFDLHVRGDARAEAALDPASVTHQAVTLYD